MRHLGPGGIPDLFHHSCQLIPVEVHVGSRFHPGPKPRPGQSEGLFLFLLDLLGLPKISSHGLPRHGRCYATFRNGAGIVSVLSHLRPLDEAMSNSDR